MSALHDFLAVQVPNEKRIRRDLLSAAREIERQVARLKSTGRSSNINIRIAQYRLALAAINNQLAELWNGKIAPAISDGVEASVSAAANMDVLTDLLIAESGMSKSAWELAMRQTANNNIEAYRRRLEGASYRPLSDRVYRNAQLSKNLIGKTISDSLLSGESAAEMAKKVAALIRPDVPGGVSYAALRLGRSELNNAFHATTIQHYENFPWVKRMEWRLSGSHPKADICDSLVGTYKPEDTPAKPHPQCFCYVTPVTITEDQFIKRYKSGEFDSFLDSVMIPGR